ncbi:MAG: hypothetical protein J6P58_06215 [Oscillospiraceae bacterium]|nr:hypothetical protein [Oscillospiraceae bacterium]
MKRKLAAVLSALLLLGALAGCCGNTASSGNAHPFTASAGDAYFASAGNAYFASAGNPRK